MSAPQIRKLIEAMKKVHEGDWLDQNKERPAKFKQMADIFRVQPEKFAAWIGDMEQKHWLDGNIAELVKYGNITWAEIQTAFNLPYNKLGSTVSPSAMKKLEQMYGGGSTEFDRTKDE
jgi:hypothetical protein